jgi:hypothetical protein
VRKTKLGLREFVKLGAFQQIINIRDSLAVSGLQSCRCCLAAAVAGALSSMAPLPAAVHTTTTTS